MAKKGRYALSGPEARRLRRRLGLSQDVFWNGVGVTQSSGSRYEKNGRAIPKPVQQLIRLRHIEGISEEALEKTTGEDLRILEYFRHTEPELYEHFHQEVQRRIRHDEQSF